jgi:hypothetical protein
MPPLLLPPFAGFQHCFNPAFFRPSHCRHRGCGSVRGEKMRPPIPPTIASAKTLGSNTLLPGGFRKGWDHPNDLLSVPAVTAAGQLFTACARRRSGEAWKEPTHLTLGFRRSTRLGCGGPTRATRSSPANLRGYHRPPLSGGEERDERAPHDHAAGASSGSNRPCFQVTVSAPAGTSPVSR